MNLPNSQIAVPLALGFMLAVFKVVYLFFDVYNVLDVVVFSIAGFVFSRNVPPNQIKLWFLLALPAVILCLFFVLRLGYTSIIQGVGTTFVVSLILIPLATFTGTLFNLKRFQ